MVWNTPTLFHIRLACYRYSSPEQGPSPHCEEHEHAPTTETKTTTQAGEADTSAFTTFIEATTPSEDAGQNQTSDAARPQQEAFVVGDWRTGASVGRHQSCPPWSVTNAPGCGQG